LKFRCLKKKDKETLHSAIGVQTKAEKCFITRKLDFLTAHQYFGHGHEEFKTAHLTVGSSKSLTRYLSTQLSPVKVIRPNVFMVVVEIIKNLEGLERRKIKSLTSLALSLSTTRFNIKKILHGFRFALSVLYGSQNSQRPLLYTSLTDRFL
jgi:hypothetical protein